MKTRILIISLIGAGTILGTWAACVMLTAISQFMLNEQADRLLRSEVQDWTKQIPYAESYVRNLSEYVQPAP